jgi:predicted RNA methylase
VVEKEFASVSDVARGQLVRGGHACVGRLKGLASPRLRIALMNAATRLMFDRRLRAQTEGWIELADLGLPSEHRVHYQPSPWLTLPRAIRRSEVRRDDVFIDFGCGMGRMVLEAALLYPFDRVIGVELSEDLVRIARGNVDRNRRRLAAREVELLVCDVLEYQVPDDVTVAFFYNPFVGPIFEHVVRELLASVERAPRRMRIIYRNPVEEPMLLATGRIRRVGSGRSFTRRGGEQTGIAVYEVDPA